MKTSLRNLLAGAAIIGASSAANAQLADGSIAPDFTFNDITGTSHTLYDYLDDGYTVFLDFSAAWCGPCWSYHNSHALRDLYENHGPAGMPSVIGGTTDDAMVFFIEGQLTNTAAQLTGTSTGSTNATFSQGNWVTGTTYPIIDLPNNSAGVATMNGYNIGYFPTIYKICPNRVITEVGQINATALYAEVGTCPPPASMANDAALLSMPGVDNVVCSGGTADLKVRIQNNGLSTLTAATIVASISGSPVATFPYTGSLATYDYADVSIGTSPVMTGATTVTYTVTAAGDATASNDTKTQNYTVSSLNPASNLITVKITTDAYGSETTWKMYNSAGTVVGSGGPYGDLSSAGTTVQPDANLVLPSDCYKFEISDLYGDGMCCAYGNGAYQVKITSAGTAFTSGGTFGSTDIKKFKNISGTVGELEIITENSVVVYPNPANTEAFVDVSLVNASDVTIRVMNSVGQTVYTSTRALSPGSNVIKLDFDGYTTGMYYVTVLAENTAVTKKLNVIK